MGILFGMAGVLIGLLLVYLNTVATVIVFKVPGSHPLLNIFRTLFIWMVPVLGFAFMLRFTQQAFDCDLHHVCVPELLRNWLYDDRLEPANPNADRRYVKAALYGFAHLLNEIMNSRG